MTKLTLAAVGDISFRGDALVERVKSEQIRAKAMRSPDCVAASLQAAGFDVLNMAANHVLDCGSRGLEHTYRRIEAMGSQPVGAGPTADRARAMRVVERNGVRLGFLGYLEPCNWVLHGGGGRVSLFDLPAALDDIARCRDQVDTLVISLHAGLEFRAAPSIPRVEACRAMAAAGADLILCHHPHVPQGIERVGDCLIAYSLGNFIFPIGEYLRAAGGPNVVRSTILLVDIVDGKVGEFRREDYRIDPAEGRPYPLDDAGLAEAAAHHAELDAILADPDRLRRTWYESCLHYLKINWDAIVKAGPDRFVEQVGWRFLGNDESHNWTLGFWEMAQAAYERNSRGDFEFSRPNRPFENG